MTGKFCRYVCILLAIVSTARCWFPSEYPDYCFNDVSTNAIPSLTSDQLSKVSALKQVQIIIRHGARTAYAPGCWANYTVQWNNCNATTLMIPSNSYSSDTRAAPWLFRKLYDAYPNELGGNCETQQLLGKGYEQQQANGNFLFQAYLNNSNPSLNLFPTNQWELINTTTDIYLRSSDTPRTVMSGQVLIGAFFNVSSQVIVDWHTGDDNMDQMYPNSDVCPNLDPLADTIYASSAYQAENTSSEVQTLSNQLNIILGEGYWDWSSVQDCMMTTVCSGRDIPDGSAEQGAVMDQTIFNNTNDQVTFISSYEYLYNDSQWAKLAMGNLAWHVRTNLQNMLNTEDMTSTSTNNVSPYKLVLFSGHDSTVMPFLAAVLKANWDKQWARFASLVTIELYESSADVNGVDPGDDLFRLVYNGVPQLVPGCSDTLCSVSVLQNALSFGQEVMPDCAIPTDSSNVVDDSDDCTDSGGMANSYWILIVFLSLVVGFVCGMAAVVCSVHGRSNSGKGEEEDTTANVQLHSVVKTPFSDKI